MSSEMRELVKRWRERANSLYLERDNESDTKAHGIDDCADDLSALLARTEAGADGRLSNQDDFTVVDCPKCGTCVQFVRKDAAALRPQDASGDAERFAFLEKRATQSCAYDVFGNGGHWSIGLHSPDGRMSFREAIDSAMQAKEAK